MQDTFMTRTEAVGHINKRTPVFITVSKEDPKEEDHIPLDPKVKKQNKVYKEQANKKRKKLLFEVGDLVWVYLRKQRFPNQQFSKLQARTDGPFWVIQKMGDNAYCRMRMEYPLSLMLLTWHHLWIL